MQAKNAKDFQKQVGFLSDLWEKTSCLVHYMLGWGELRPVEFRPLHI